MSKISLKELSNLLRQKTKDHLPKEVGGGGVSILQQKCDELVKNALPHGSGFDAGCELDFFASSAKKIVFITSYHHLNQDGYYDGWTNHSVVVTPDFDGFDIRITGRDRNQIKDYIYEVFYDCFEL